MYKKYLFCNIKNVCLNNFNIHSLLLQTYSLIFLFFDLINFKEFLFNS